MCKQFVQSRQIAAVILALALQSATVLATSTDTAHCLHVLTLKPNQKVTIATVVQNEGALYSSRVINFSGRVTTDDGINKLAEAWIKHEDLLRWGVNEDINALGPVFNFGRRMVFIGKGMSEIRVRTGNSPTKVCMCTELDMDDQNASYPARHKACMESITK